MKYAEIVDTIVDMAAAAPEQTFMIWGAPGCGKSHAATNGISKAMGFPAELAKDLMFRPSGKDPVDLYGMPVVNSKTDTTEWIVPGFLRRINEAAKNHDRVVFVIDEVNQATGAMFNVLNGLLLDRRIGDFKLAPNVTIVATGNRQTDKAASNRMPSHTANRIAHFDMDSDLDGWCEWAVTEGNIPINVVAFLKFKPALLNDFDPDRRENPTERTWEMVGRALGGAAVEYVHHNKVFRVARSLVGEGPAAELAGFYEIAATMPNPDAVIMDPSNAPLPTELSAKFAICGALAARANQNNLDRVLTYVSRLERQFEVMALKDALRRNSGLMATRAFVTWASKNGDVFKL